MIRAHTGFLFMMAIAASVGMVSASEVMRQHFQLHTCAAGSYTVGFSWGLIAEARKKNRRPKIRRRR